MFVFKKMCFLLCRFNHRRSRLLGSEPASSHRAAGKRGGAAGSHASHSSPWRHQRCNYYTQNARIYPVFLIFYFIFWNFLLSFAKFFYFYHWFSHDWLALQWQYLNKCKTGLPIYLFYLSIIHSSALLSWRKGNISPEPPRFSFPKYAPFEKMKYWDVELLQILLSRCEIFLRVNSSVKLSLIRHCV